jgi:hypothetical protein
VSEHCKTSVQIEHGATTGLSNQIYRKKEREREKEKTKRENMNNGK